MKTEFNETPCQAFAKLSQGVGNSYSNLFRYWVIFDFLLAALFL